MFSNARKILDDFLDVTAGRKTPERYAILEAIYDIDGHFTVEELNDRLSNEKFVVSRAIGRFF